MTPPNSTVAVEASPPPAARSGWITLIRIAALLVAVAMVFVVAKHWNRWTGGAEHQRTDDAFLQTDITPIGAKVSGYVLRAPVDDFAQVRRGDLLLELVPDDYRVALELQEANIASAQAALLNNTAQVALQRANVQAAEAALDGVTAVQSRNRREAARQRRLASEGAGTEQAQEVADTSELQSAAQAKQSRAQLAAAEQQIRILAASRQQTQAALAAAQAGRDAAALNLGYTRIAAPTDGVVGQRQIRIGQYVSAGQQVAVVAALPRIWVIANFKESQIRRMRAGQACEITVDAFPEQPLKGYVVGFAPGTGSQFALLPPDNATGNFTKVVQRVGVKIAIHDVGALRDQLRPGLSVVASVHTAP